MRFESTAKVLAECKLKYYRNLRMYLILENHLTAGFSQCSENQPVPRYMYGQHNLMIASIMNGMLCR